MSFVQEMAQRLSAVTQTERCLSFRYDKHELRWYHGFSRPFGDRTLFYLQKAFAEIQTNKERVFSHECLRSSERKRFY